MARVRRARRDATIAAEVAIRQEGQRQSRKNHRWNADGVSRDALTSMDVLLTWLTMPDNMARWNAQRHKADLCNEVVAAMHDEGIKHRDIKSVYAKIMLMKKQFTDAHEWLERTGSLEAHMNGTSGEEVEARVRRLCPQYRELIPVFGRDAAAEETDVVDAVDKDSEGGDVSSDEEPPEDEELVASDGVQEQSEAEDKVGEEPQGDSDSDADATEEDESERVTRPASMPVRPRKQATKAITRTRKAREETSKPAPAAAKRQRVVEDDWMPQGDIQDIERESLLKRVEEEQQHRLEVFEIERAKSHCELEIKCVEMLCEKALMRKKLLGAGVDLSEVDRLIPL